MHGKLNLGPAFSQYYIPVNNAIILHMILCGTCMCLTQLVATENSDYNHQPLVKMVQIFGQL